MSLPVLIVGGGPAGLSAGIQLQRAGIPTLLFESERLAHQVTQAHSIENVLGFSRISGGNLAKRLAAQVATWKLPVKFERVLGVSRDEEGFQVQTPIQTYRGREVILATGTTPKSIGLPELEALKGQGVFDRVTDLIRKESGHVVIVGAGDIAFDAALRLVDHHQVSILMRDQEPAALSLLVNRVAAYPSIRWYRGCEIQRVRRGARQIELGLRGTDTSVLCDYVLISIGRSPQLPPIAFPIRQELCAAPDCYLIGDVLEGKYRQIGIAMGDGLKAAMMILDHRRTDQQPLPITRQQNHVSKS